MSIILREREQKVDSNDALDTLNKKRATFDCGIEKHTSEFCKHLYHLLLSCVCNICNACLELYRIVSYRKYTAYVVGCSDARKLNKTILILNQRKNSAKYMDFNVQVSRQ